MSVNEGESVVLQNDAAELQKDDLLIWRFGDEGILLAKIDVETNNHLLNDDDERFRNRLQLNQTGSLTITNARTEHAGLYEVQIRGRGSSKQFLVSVRGEFQIKGLLKYLEKNQISMKYKLASMYYYKHGYRYKKILNL